MIPKVVGNILVEQPIEEMGQVKDINGESWEVISIWSGGDYVTAAKTKDVSDDYSRWSPYEVQVVGNAAH